MTTRRELRALQMKAAATILRSGIKPVIIAPVRTRMNATVEMDMSLWALPDIQSRNRYLSPVYLSSAGEIVTLDDLHIRVRLFFHTKQMTVCTFVVENFDDPPQQLVASLSKVIDQHKCS